MRHFESFVSNTLQGFERQRRLPQFQVLFSASMPGLGQLAASGFVQCGRVYARAWLREAITGKVTDA